MAGIPMELCCNSLLWHWMRFILFLGCVALACGLTRTASAADNRPVIAALVTA